MNRFIKAIEIKKNLTLIYQHFKIYYYQTAENS